MTCKTQLLPTSPLRISAAGGAAPHRPAVGAHDSAGASRHPDPPAVGRSCLCHPPIQPPVWCASAWELLACLPAASVIVCECTACSPDSTSAMVSSPNMVQAQQSRRTAHWGIRCSSLLLSESPYSSCCSPPSAPPTRASAICTAC